MPSLTKSMHSEKGNQISKKLERSRNWLHKSSTVSASESNTGALSNKPENQKQSRWAANKKGFQSENGNCFLCQRRCRWDGHKNKFALFLSRRGTRICEWCQGYSFSTRIHFFCPDEERVLGKPLRRRTAHDFAKKEQMMACWLHALVGALQIEIRLAARKVLREL